MWNMLIGAGGSIIAAGVILFFSCWYNRKRQSDAEANEYTRLINEITNLNTKIANASEATKNDYTHLRNEMNNLNTKFENGFERFFLEIDKLRSTAKTNTEKIDALSSNVDTNTQKIDAINIIFNKNITTTDEIMKTIIELQNIVGDFIKLPRSQ